MIVFRIDIHFRYLEYFAILLPNIIPKHYYIITKLLAHQGVRVKTPDWSYCVRRPWTFSTEDKGDGFQLYINSFKFIDRPNKVLFFFISLDLSSSNFQYIVWIFSLAFSQPNWNNAYWCPFLFFFLQYVFLYYTWLSTRGSILQSFQDIFFSQIVLRW